MEMTKISVDTSLKPWAEGTKELLVHSFKLLKDESNSLRRIAFICIDNAVELMIKTYLTLPKRITKIDLSRAKLNELIESFPKMLDALDEYASDKLDGIDINEIEWFHRIRNDLYHNGHGFLIERKYVEIYAEIAKQLFENLFNCPLELEISAEVDDSLLGRFIHVWAKVQKAVGNLVEVVDSSMGGFDDINQTKRRPPLMELPRLRRHPFLEQRIPVSKIRRIDELRAIRSQVIHGAIDYKEVLTKEIVKELNDFADELSQIASEIETNSKLETNSIDET